MAIEVANSNKVETLFNKLESQKTLLTKCTDLYRTLTSHFANLDSAIATKSQTLDSKLQSLSSNYDKSLELLQSREDSIPNRLLSLSSQIETLKESALESLQNPNNRPLRDAPLSESLKLLCKTMDYVQLQKLLISKRKEAAQVRAHLGEALAQSVDPPRLVLDTVKEFVDVKLVAKTGLTDKRWACGMLVGAMFPIEEIKEGKCDGFPRAVVARAESVVKEWREKAEKLGKGGGDGEGEIGMGPAEGSMFLQVVLGFGLKDKFEEEFYRKMVMEFSARKDISKLALRLFEDKVGDIIEELIKNGKEVEAVYFATESGLTERFQCISLLKSFLRNYKKNITEILKKGNHSAAANDEANSFEINSIKSIIRCVEDLKLESQFTPDSLRKRLAVLEKAKAEKKKASLAAPKPSNKRGYGSGAVRNSGPPPPRAVKMPRYSAPHLSYGHINPVSPSPAQQSPVSRYAGPYSYQSQTTYDTGLTSSAYGPSYGASHIPSPAHISQQHYGIPGDSAGGVAPRLGSSYGEQIGYSSYDYGAAAAPPPAYQPPSYP